MGIMEFQSTPPRGGRLRKACTVHLDKCFNPRPHVGGDFRPRNASNMESPLLFQSTPPRGGRLSSVNATDDELIVSIHAPTWGATCSCGD